MNLMALRVQNLEQKKKKEETKTTKLRAQN